MFSLLQKKHYARLYCLCFQKTESWVTCYAVNLAINQTDVDGKFVALIVLRSFSLSNNPYEGPWQMCYGLDQAVV